MPDVYIRDLDDLGRDSPLQNHEWMAFMEKAMTEWQEITLYVSGIACLNALLADMFVRRLEYGATEREYCSTDYSDRRYGR